MKYRDSGMPDVEMWETFFDPHSVLINMEVNSSIAKYLDIGCGYGTFLFPAAEIVKQAVGYDIDRDMIKNCDKIVKKYKKRNIKLLQGDISNEAGENFLRENRNGFDYISLFNILHCEEPVKLLNIAEKLLSVKGRIGVIHWQYKETPRGPSMNIRPRPEQIINWAESVSLNLLKTVDLPPCHYGLLFGKQGG